MLKKVIEHYKARRDIRNIEQHPLYGIVLSYLRDVLGDKSQGIGKYWNEDGKGKLIANIISDIERVTINQPNPVQAVRTRLLELMLFTAQLAVLVIPPPPEEDTSDLRKYEGITGELKSHIPDLAKVDKNLEELFYGMKETPKTFNEMFDIILMRYWVLFLQMNAYNQVRMYLKDYVDNPSKDWFRPAYFSLCIRQEHHYREALKLPTALLDDKYHFKALIHSSWVNRIDGGDNKEMRLDWEKCWTGATNEPSPYADK